MYSVKPMKPINQTGKQKLTGLVATSASYAWQVLSVPTASQ
jgi:hypothetical protein